MKNVEYMTNKSHGAMYTPAEPFARLTPTLLKAGVVSSDCFDGFFVSSWLAAVLDRDWGVAVESQLG